MNVSDEWQDLARVWQAQAIDLPRLQKSTRWKTWRMLAVLASEVLAMGFLFWLCLWGVPEEKPRAVKIFMWSWTALCTLIWILSMRCRRGTWRLQDQSVHGLLMLKQKRAQAGWHLARWSVVFSGFAILVSWGAPYFLFAPQALPDFWVRYGPASVSTVILLLWGLGAYLYQRQRERELQALAKLMQDLQSPVVE